MYKQPVSVLNEAAQKKIIPEPQYKSKQVESGFVTDVTIGNKTYQSKVATTKAQSKEEAASIVLKSITQQTTEKVITYKTICELVLKLEKYSQTEKPLKLIQQFGNNKENANVAVYSDLLQIFTTSYVRGEPYTAILADMWNKLMHIANGNCVRCDNIQYTGTQAQIDENLLNGLHHGSMLEVLSEAAAQAIRNEMDSVAEVYSELPPLISDNDFDFTEINENDAGYVAEDEFVYATFDDYPWILEGERTPGDDSLVLSQDFSTINIDDYEETEEEEESNTFLDFDDTIWDENSTSAVMQRNSLVNMLTLQLSQLIEEHFDNGEDDLAVKRLADLGVVNNWATPMSTLNAMMHALNGNGSKIGQGEKKKTTKRVRPAVKKVVKKEVKKELKREEPKSIRKTGNKLPGKTVKAQARNGRRLNVGSEHAIIGLMKSAFKAELKAIVAPSAVAPVRYSTIFASAKTAIAAPWRQDDASWAPETYDGEILPADSMMVFMYRDAARHTVTYRYNVIPYTYHAWMQSVSGGSLSQEWTGTVISSGLGLDLAYLAPKDNASIFAHGMYLPVGVTEANRKGGVPMTKNEKFNFTCETGVGAEWSFAVQVYCFDGEDFKPVTSVPVPNSSVTSTAFTATFNGYYYFKVYGILTSVPDEPVTLEDCIITCNLENTGTPYFAHNMLPDLEHKLDAIRSIRIIGASMMYSNTAANLQKQGKIACFQASGNVHWTTFVDEGFKMISGAQGGSRALLAEKGLYAFVKPTGESDFEMMNPIDYDGSILCKIKFPLDKCKSYLAMAVSIEEDLGKAGIFTFGSSVEFETEDTWFIVNEPKTDKRVFDQALNAVKSVQQFHENPLHIDEIWNSAKNLAGKIFDGIITYGPSVIKGAQMLSSFL